MAEQTDSIIPENLGLEGGGTGDGEPRNQGSGDGGAGADTDVSGTAGTDNAAAQLAGTPFRTVGDLKTGFQNLQRALNAKHSELATSQKTTGELLKNLTGLFSGKSGGAVTKEDADTFLKRFLQDPAGTLAETTRKIAQAEVEAAIGPQRAATAALQTDRMISNFMTDRGKALLPEEQARFLVILEENPWVMNTPDPLHQVYSMLVSEDVDGFQKRRLSSAAGEAGLTAAKGAAAGVGGKRVATGSQGGRQRDEFDDVLDRFRSLTSNSGLNQSTSKL